MVTVRLDMKKDCFFAEFSNLGVGNVPIADEYPGNLDEDTANEIIAIFRNLAHE